jgi:membrane protein
MPRQQTSPWELGGLTWIELGKRTWAEMNKDDVFGRSAELSYYFFLAIFPGLFFLVSIFGIIAHGNPRLQQELMSYMGRVMPGEASGLVSQTLQQIVQSSNGTKLWLGLAGALWSASAGMSSIMDVLNITYGVKEGRPFWKKRLISIGLTIVVVALIIAALVLILYGPTIANMIFGRVGLGDVIAWIWKIVQWPVSVFFVIVAYAVIYYKGPDVKQPTWHWVSPGAAVGVFLWLVASFGFKVYLSFSNSYSKTYGALGGVIILLLWFYITGLAILTGSIINSEIEHAAAKRGEPEAKMPGRKAA